MRLRWAEVFVVKPPGISNENRNCPKQILQRDERHAQRQIIHLALREEGSTKAASFAVLIYGDTRTKPGPPTRTYMGLLFLCVVGK